MPNIIGSLPTHPLLVHIPVAFVPLAALGVVVLAVRPSWLRTFGPLVAGFAAVGFVGAVLATSTGETLEDDLRSTGMALSDRLHDHTEMGDRVQVVAGIFLVLTLAWVLFAAWRRRVGDERATAKVRKPRLVALVLSVLVVASGAVATASVVAAGHSGASSVWEQSAP